MAILTKVVIHMKALLLILIHFFFLVSAQAGTCSSISRTNFSSNQILTSSALNSQFNTVYGQTNDLDAGCLTDGTLEFSALNTSDFSPMINAIQRGCKVEYSDSNTVTISECFATVNGAAVAKSSATSATWGCTDCSSETASTDYYVYIKNGSTGSTVTPLISTTAPDDDGYDSSNNMVVGKFTNDGSSNIATDSFYQWHTNDFSGRTRIAYLKDVKSAGTAGGGSSAGENDRVLNTLTGDTSFISLDSSQFTLVPGIYDIWASSPGFNVGSHQVVLKNVTDSTVPIIGNIAYADAGNSVGNYTTLIGRVIITSNKTFKVTHYTQAAQGSNGLGVGYNTGYNNIYTQVRVTKIE